MPVTHPDQSKLIYLASPYTSDDPNVPDLRETAIGSIAANLAYRGITLFCPILHGCAIARHHRGFADWDHDKWMDFNSPFIEAADELWVAMLDGWKTSRGVSWEIEYAKDLGMPIRYVNERDCRVQDYPEA